MPVLTPLHSLSKDEIFSKLIGYVVDLPDASLPEKQRFKSAALPLQF